MLTKPQFFYDHTTKQALGFQNPFYLKKTQQLEPKLYDGNVIKNTSTIVIPDFEETLILAKESRSKILLKQKDPMMVSKLIAENEHLKQTYKQLYDSIKPARIRSKEQCEDLINQVNLKSVEISDLNASLQEKVLVITALKDDLQKLKGNDLVDNSVTKHPSDPEMLKIDVEPIISNFLNKRTAHSAYIKHTQEEAEVVRDLVDHIKDNYPLDYTLDSACRKPRKYKTNVLVSKSKVLKSVSANKKEPSQSWGSIVFDVPSSSLKECRSSKLFFVKFGNDQVARLLGYGDYHIGNVTISRVYYVEGLGRNLFLVGQFCDLNLEVAFRQHTCFIRNLEGVDLLTGSRGNNLYTLSFGDMMIALLL
ncbi:hypothetical protein Tco_1508079 [Tanacetum coccineum]